MAHQLEKKGMENYVQKWEDSEINHKRGIVGEDDRTSREGKTNLLC